MKTHHLVLRWRYPRYRTFELHNPSLKAKSVATLARCFVKVITHHSSMPHLMRNISDHQFSKHLLAQRTAPIIPYQTPRVADINFPVKIESDKVQKPLSICLVMRFPVREA